MYVWFHDRNEALRRAEPGFGAPAAAGGGARQASFRSYDPISECGDVKWWGSWHQFNKCAPFLPTGEKMWTLGLAVRLVTIFMYFWSCFPMMNKFRAVHIGKSSFYRGLRAEVAIVKTAAWEAAFIAIGVWYAPLGLNDYLLWGNMPTVSFFLMLCTVAIFLTLAYELCLTFSDLCVDFEYPECSLARKFDKSWRAYEKILEKHLKQVKSTRLQKPSRGDPRFLELLELPPDELEVGQVLLYQWNPDGTRVRRTTSDGEATTGEGDNQQGPGGAQNVFSGGQTQPTGTSSAADARTGFAFAAAAGGSSAYASSFRLGTRSVMAEDGRMSLRDRRQLCDANPWLDEQLREVLSTQPA